jgi:hypothetical protein
MAVRWSAFSGENALETRKERVRRAARFESRIIQPEHAPLSVLSSNKVGCAE